MSQALTDAQKTLHELYREVDMVLLSEVMILVNKYSTEEGKRILENQIGVIQADSMELTALNFTIGQKASEAESDVAKARNARKYQYAKQFLRHKEENSKHTMAQLEQMAEYDTFDFRDKEIQLEKKANLFRQANASVIEVVNMLKKTVEKLMWQGQGNNY